MWWIFFYRFGKLTHNAEITHIFQISLISVRKFSFAFFFRNRISILKNYLVRFVFLFLFFFCLFRWNLIKHLLELLTGLVHSAGKFFAVQEDGMESNLLAALSNYQMVAQYFCLWILHIGVGLDGVSLSFNGLQLTEDTAARLLVACVSLAMPTAPTIP